MTGLGPTSGEVLHCGHNPDPGDYGNVIVTAHRIRLAADDSADVAGGDDGGGTATLYALYGHLSAVSTAGKQPGDPVARGDVVGYAATPTPTPTPNRGDVVGYAATPT